MDSTEPLVELTDDERISLLLKEIAAAALNSEITRHEFYSVCPINTLSEMADSKHEFRHTKEYKILHALHCMNYKEMTPDMKRNLPELIQIAVKPIVGSLEISDKRHKGIRLFRPDYLPRKYVEADVEEVGTKWVFPGDEPVDSKPSWFRRLRSRLRLS